MKNNSVSPYLFSPLVLLLWGNHFFCGLCVCVIFIHIMLTAPFLTLSVLKAVSGYLVMADDLTLPIPISSSPWPSHASGPPLPFSLPSDDTYSLRFLSALLHTISYLFQHTQPHFWISGHSTLIFYILRIATTHVYLFFNLNKDLHDWSVGSESLKPKNQCSQQLVDAVPFETPLAGVCSFPYEPDVLMLLPWMKHVKCVLFTPCQHSCTQQVL